MKCADFIFNVLVALLIAAVIASPVACTMQRQQLIATAIKDGADPIATNCALGILAGQDQTCIVAATHSRSQP